MYIVRNVLHTPIQNQYKEGSTQLLFLSSHPSHSLIELLLGGREASASIQTSHIFTNSSISIAIVCNELEPAICIVFCC